MTAQPVLPRRPADPGAAVDDALPSLPGEPTAQELRAACAEFATGVVVVTASAAGREFGGTVNSFTSLSLDPPQVIVCLARTSNTWSAVEESGAFAVNVLAADQLAVARLFASKDPDKMSRVDTRPGVRGLPLIDGALAYFECALSEAIPAGTHMVLIGRVLRVRTETAKAPALFFRSRLVAGPALAGAPLGPRQATGAA